MVCKSNPASGCNALKSFNFTNELGFDMAFTSLLRYGFISPRNRVNKLLSLACLKIAI